MTIKRLDHVSVVVDDLAAAIAFFTALGMTVEGEAPVEGPWADRVNGLERVQVDIVMMRTPDAHGRLELTKFRNPKLVDIEPAIAPRTRRASEASCLQRKRRRHCRSPARQRRGTRRRGCPVRGQVQTLLRARPCWHHRRAGRGTLLKRSPPSEKPVAP